LRRSANSDHAGETFSVDATEELDGNEDVSIGSAWYDRRWKIVALNDAHGVAAPTKPDADVGLGRESNFVGVNSYQ
jgi:hypothetical protein